MHESALEQVTHAEQRRHTDISSLRIRLYLHAMGHKWLIWTNHSKKCFQNLVASMLQKIKAVTRTNMGQLGARKVYLIKWLVSVNVCSLTTQIYIFVGKPIEKCPFVESQW